MPPRSPTAPATASPECASGRVEARGSPAWPRAYVAPTGPSATSPSSSPAQPAEIAPIIVEAHDLTEREQQISLLITKGASTAKIAARLFLSRHTVRDHIKAILHKVGVSSRGELVAKVFAEHYQPTHLHDAIHVDTGEWA
jgi:DNA-binding NarL/FixJ family response regulator